MRDFFKGWRRKAGCVTLVMACVFLESWVTCLGQWSSGYRGNFDSVHCGKNSSDVYSIVCGNTRWISLNASLIWDEPFRKRSERLWTDAPFLYTDVEHPFGPGGCLSSANLSGVEWADLSWEFEASLGISANGMDRARWFKRFPISLDRSLLVDRPPADPCCPRICCSASRDRRKANPTIASHRRIPCVSSSGGWRRKAGCVTLGLACVLHGMLLVCPKS